MYENAINKISQELLTHSLPSRPKSFGKEYDFPEDISGVQSMHLGNWLLKLAAWRGYTIRLLAKTEMEFTIMDDAFNAKVTKQLAQITEKRITKEQAVGKVLADPESTQLKVKLIEKHGQLVSMKRLLEIYTTQFEAISREISRRGIESRLVQQGVSE